MLMILCEAIQKAKSTEPEFFVRAHVHTYGCRDRSNTDFVQFKLYGIIPLYVREYAKYILESS